MAEHADVQHMKNGAKRRTRLEKRAQRIAPVLQHVHEATDRFSFASPWDFLTADHDCRTGVVDELELVAELAEHFTAWDMIEAGVAVEDDTEGVILNPTLLEGPVIFLRNQEDRLFDIMTPDGTCVSGACPLFRVAHDRLTTTSAPAEVLAVCSIGEVALMRAVGQAASPLTSLARLNAHGTRRMMRLTGVETTSVLQSVPDRLVYDLPEDVFSQDGPGGASLTLVLASSAFRRPSSQQAEERNAVVGHFLNSGEYLQIRWGDVHVWRPTSKELAELAFRRRQRLPEVIQEYFQMERATHCITDLDPSGRPPPAPTVAESLENASQELATGKPKFDDAPGEWAERRARAMAERTLLLEKHCLLPLIERGIENPDQVEGQLQIQLADSFRMAQACLPMLRRQLEQSSHSDLESDRPLVHPDAMKLYQKFTNDQFRIARELRKLN